MKVRCLKLLDSRGRDASESHWLGVGKEYVVVSILIRPAGDTLLRILNDRSMPTLHPISQFEITDHKLPSLWTIFAGNDNSWVIAPERWAETGLWDRYFDGEPLTVSEVNMTIGMLAGS